jgi:hypothetical protein
MNRFCFPALAIPSISAISSFVNFGASADGPTMFDLILPSFVERVITHVPFATCKDKKVSIGNYKTQGSVLYVPCHPSNTSAGFAPCFSATRTIVSSERSGEPFDPSGEYACGSMPLDLQNSTSAWSGLYGCNSSWFAAGTILQDGRKASSFFLDIFDTPIALTLPIRRNISQGTR